jgi:hypothetical protein
MKEVVELVHPKHADLSFLYGTIFVGKAKDPIHHNRNVCIFAEGEVDRSPAGTGVSGRAAIHVARGELDMGQTISIEAFWERPCPLRQYDHGLDGGPSRNCGSGFGHGTHYGQARVCRGPKRSTT